MSATGGTIGPYVLGAEVGRGASGTVYAATDSKLDRKVALKVLSDEVASTSEQRARFAREARLLAAVSHPNVATVYGVVEEGEHVWLALEFLEGETLADELARGPLPMREALDAARQIADGLEAAHESGVVHRDLKPANVKRGRDGVVKVLDFGLAKPVRAELSDSADLSSDGLVLGTPLYMSPEQLRGKATDRRTDVWAFGCVLWELLTGARAFSGETTADVLHAILELDPDPSKLPSNTPARVRELLGRCLHKDARQRLRDLGDARLELESALAERAWTESTSTAGLDGPRRAWVLPVAAALLAALAGLLVGRLSSGASDARGRQLRLSLDLPAGRKQTHPRVHPDGGGLVFEVSDGESRESRRLVSRRFDSFDEQPIPGTQRVDTYEFSRDGRSLAVVRETEGDPGRFELVTLPLDGSEPPRFIGALPPNLSTDGALGWLEDGRIVLSTRPRNLLVVHLDGSGRMDEIAMKCDEELWPQAPDVHQALPGRPRVLASSLKYSGRLVQNHLVAIDVETAEQTVLVENSRHAAWLETGHLLFSRADVLFAVAFDADSLEMKGEPVPIASGLRTELAWMSGQFHASREGTVVWYPGGMLGAKRGLSWVRRGTPPEPWSDASLPLEGFLDVDDTGTFLTAVVSGPSGSYELWGSEVDTPMLRPLLADPRYDFFSGYVLPDHRELIFTRYGKGAAEIRRTSLDDPEEGTLLLREEREGYTIMSARVADEGRLLTAFQRGPDGVSLIGCELAGEPPYEARTIFHGSHGTRTLSLSPDARWLLVRSTGEPPTVRRLLPDGSVGKPWPVAPSAPGAWATFWARQSASEPLRLILMPPSNTSLLEVTLREGPDGPEFSEPEPLVELEEQSFWDAEHVRDDEFITILIDRDQDALDSVQVLMGIADELPAD